jgi:hypothetical protein
VDSSSVQPASTWWHRSASILGLTSVPCAAAGSAHSQIKTLTKPLANQIKGRATNEGWIRTACLRYGHYHHAIESRAVLRLAGHQAKTIKPATDDTAVGIGATVFSEFFVFSVASSILAFELWRKSIDDEAAAAKKAATAARERSELEQRFQAVEAEIAELRHELKEARQDHAASIVMGTKKGWLK